MSSFLLDFKLDCAITIGAESAKDAAKLLRQAIQCATVNLGSFPNGDPILAEASLNQPPVLISIDGEEIEPTPVKTAGYDYPAQDHSTNHVGHTVDQRLDATSFKPAPVGNVDNFDLIEREFRAIPPTGTWVASGYGIDGNLLAVYVRDTPDSEYRCVAFISGSRDDELSALSHRVFTGVTWTCAGPCGRTFTGEESQDLGVPHIDGCGEPVCFDCLRQNDDNCPKCGGDFEFLTDAELARISAKPGLKELPVWFDYANQAWVRDGVYVKCDHVNLCTCYGRLHQGEKPAPETREKYGIAAEGESHA